jgi:hypothetical protein
MPNITEIMNPPKPPKTTCIYVVLGREVVRREEDSHPGMDVVRIKWDHEESVPNTMTPRMVKSVRQGYFYWDHLDARGNHVFVCHDPLSIQVQFEGPKDASPILQQT